MYILGNSLLELKTTDAVVLSYNKNLPRHLSFVILPFPSQMSGIVQGKANVVAVLPKGDDFKSFQITFPQGATTNISIGASVAINGTCLTVISHQPNTNTLSFDVIEETLLRTNLGSLAPGSNVNYERSAKYGDEVGGHTVSGHVHTVARIVTIKQTENNQTLVFKLDDASYIKYILPKGFVAVDGCSLTVGEVDEEDGTFSVYLIPETLRVTVLGEKGMGDGVNVEVEAQTQAIVETVERVVARMMKEKAMV
jgi:riboflavin synthase